MQSFTIVHSPDGTEILLDPITAPDREAAWQIARDRYIHEHLMVINADDED
jgi:hypothetical protein